MLIFSVITAARIITRRLSRRRLMRPTSGSERVRRSPITSCPKIPSFRHPEVLAPPQISLRNLRTLDCVARASKGDGPGRSSFEGRDAAKLAQAAQACLRARPPQDDGISDAV